MQGSEHGSHNTPSETSLTCEQRGLPYYAHKQLIHNSSATAVSLTENDYNSKIQDAVVYTVRAYNAWQERQKGTSVPPSYSKVHREELCKGKSPQYACLVLRSP